MLSWFIFVLSSVTSTTIDDYACKFEILSNDDANGVTGRYFNFDVSTVNCILGYTFSTNSIFTVFYSGDNSQRTVKMWNVPNGAAGDGHGRIEPYGSSSPNQWATGEYVAFADGLCSCSKLK